LSATIFMSAMPLSGGFAGTEGAWAERSMVLYDAANRTVVRRTIRVWDPHPEKALDFVWEPDASLPLTASSQGAALEGKGRLTWRVKGSPSYDPRTVYSEYSGEVRDGRPHGVGELRFRSGETMRGTFEAGLLEGEGLWIDAAGNRIEGAFHAGRPDGHAVERRITGEIYEGAFRDGQRDGKGQLKLAGGASFDGEWRNGAEVSGRPAMLADRTVGGVLKAQTGANAADKAEFTVAIDQRMTEQADMRYTQYVDDQSVQIYPEDEAFNTAWNGDGQMNGAGTFDFVDWSDAPAFVEIGLATKDGSRVAVNKLELQVESSKEYRKPMLGVANHMGCVGFRPSFNFVNNGWGAAEKASVTVKFVNSGTGAETGEYSKQIGDFDEGADVMIDDLLQQAGVDVGTLARKRFQCPSLASIGVCRSQAINSVNFGAVADTIDTASEEQIISTTAQGQIDYEWTDADGQKVQASEGFETIISLAAIEVPDASAECGAGMGMAPEALRYQDVDLPLGKENYTIDMPVRGNKNISKYTARLKMHSERSSIHQMEAAATFADGSMRKSKPIRFFFLMPRDSMFASDTAPQQCYLEEGFGGC
jgi:hypothetical protein